MADKQSCEGKLTTLECMVCGYREVFTESQFKFTDGFRCNECDSPVQPSITRPGEKINNRRMKKQVNRKSIGTLTVDIDCSEALKGLKAVQREAKKAVQALKEVENFCIIENLSDDDIFQELSRRGWTINETKISNCDGTIPGISLIEMRKNYNEKLGGNNT